MHKASLEARKGAIHCIRPSVAVIYTKRVNTLTEWTLEEELCAHAGVPRLPSALWRLGILEDEDHPFHLICDPEWTRGGSETFIYRFWVALEGGVTNGAILKACTSFAPGQSLTETVGAWTCRRTLLATNGVRTPKLFSSKGAVLIEELIPYDVRGLLSSRTYPPMPILEGITDYAATLACLGFNPIEFMADLRSRGDDVVAIDFGEDLGSPLVKNTGGDELFERMIGELERWHVNLEGGLTSTLRTRYSKRVSARYKHWLSNI